MFVFLRRRKDARESETNFQGILRNQLSLRGLEKGKERGREG